MTTHFRLTPRGLIGAGMRFPCSIGRGGITDKKREGDGATPVGLHHVAMTFYRPDRMKSPAPWAIPIRPRDHWCDESGHPDYNHLVTSPFAASAEAMRRADSLYDIVVVLDWNWPDAVPGRGSAIFLHRWRRPGTPTEGCIAFAPGHLRWIAPRAVPGTRLLLH